jgi:hypothetical protein
MTRRATVGRMFRAVCLVLLFSATLTGCHELYCSFVEGLTGEPIDCSHDAFPDLGEFELPPLPPPPSLPTTTTTVVTTTTTTASSTTTTTSSTTTTLPSDTTTTSSSTSTSTSTSTTVAMPGESLIAGELRTRAVTDSIRAARERAAER